MSDSKKANNEQPAEKPKLHTDHPLSEKDEVKQAEHKTAKAAANHDAGEQSAATEQKDRESKS